MELELDLMTNFRFAAIFEVRADAIECVYIRINTMWHGVCGMGHVAFVCVFLLPYLCVRNADSFNVFSTTTTEGGGMEYRSPMSGDIQNAACHKLHRVQCLGCID